MKLSNVNQPTASTWIVHHAHAGMPESYLVLTRHVLCVDVMFYSVFGTHLCVNLLLVFSVHSCILYLCLICINYICISYSSMFLC